MTRTFIGVDLSKDRLDICDPLRGESQRANRAPVIARWAARLLEAFVARMQASRKPAKVILMAVARRLIVIANAVLRDRTPFEPRSDAPA
jgi:hypothetical protein